jgi:integrase
MSAPVSDQDPARVLVEVDCWWIAYQDHNGRRCREKAFPDRSASERRLLEIRTRISRIRSGDLPESAHVRAGKSLPEMVNEWREDLESRDLTAKHVDVSVRRLSVLLEEIGAHRPADVDRVRVMRWLKAQRDRDVRPLSPSTSNQYLIAAHSFVRWMIARRYLETDPLAGSESVDEQSRRTFDRRALTPEEFSRLISTTRGSGRTSGLLTPADRVALYMVAVYTGFRAGELASLTRASFRLDPAAPQIDLVAAAAKNRKPTHQPIPETVAAVLRDWIATRPTTGPVWSPGNVRRNAPVILRRDLRAAGINPESPEGRVDFHSLRVTFGTFLANAGVPIQHAQKLLRHSTPVLTARHYTKLRAGDLSSQVDRLPPAPG